MGPVVRLGETVKQVFFSVQLMLSCFILRSKR